MNLNYIDNLEDKLNIYKNKIIIQEIFREVNYYKKQRC